MPCEIKHVNMHCKTKIRCNQKEDTCDSYNSNTSHLNCVYRSFVFQHLTIGIYCAGYCGYLLYQVNGAHTGIPTYPPPMNVPSTREYGKFISIPERALPIHFTFSFPVQGRNMSGQKKSSTKGSGSRPKRSSKKTVEHTSSSSGFSPSSPRQKAPGTGKRKLSPGYFQLNQYTTTQSESMDFQGIFPANQMSYFDTLQEEEDWHVVSCSGMNTNYSCEALGSETSCPTHSQFYLLGSENEEGTSLV